GAWAEMEPLLTIRPPRGSWLVMSLIASCVQRKAPVRLTSTTEVHCSKVTSSSGTGGAPEPGVLKRRARRPHAYFVAARRRGTRRRELLRYSLTAGARPHRLLVPLFKKTGRRPVRRPAFGGRGDGARAARPR